MNYQVGKTISRDLPQSFYTHFRDVDNSAAKLWRAVPAVCHVRCATETKAGSQNKSRVLLMENGRKSMQQCWNPGKVLWNSQNFHDGKVIHE